MNRFKEAETHLRRAIALNPQAPSAHLNLGLALYEQARYEEALDATRVAIEQDPNFFEAHVNLGGILIELERFEETLQHIDQALALDPSNEIVRANRTVVLEMMQGNVE